MFSSTEHAIFHRRAKGMTPICDGRVRTLAANYPACNFCRSGVSTDLTTESAPLGRSDRFRVNVDPSKVRWVKFSTQSPQLAKVPVRPFSEIVSTHGTCECPKIAAS